MYGFRARFWVVSKNQGTRIKSYVMELMLTKYKIAIFWYTEIKDSEWLLQVM